MRLSPIEVIENHFNEILSRTSSPQQQKNSRLFPTILGITRRTFQIVEILQGFSKIIVPPNSDVVLHVPDGVCGVLLGNIHTDPAKFAHLVRDTECIVSPVCDLHVELTTGNTQERQPFKLLIPHIMKDLELAKEKTRVQIFEHPNNDPLTALPSRAAEDNTSALPLKQAKALFCVRRSYVELLCTHFCQILVSAEAAGCCCHKANLLVFSRMDPPNVYTSLPLANMKIYLTSLLTNMEDFFQVFMSTK